jgi:hypothetical protein
MNRAIRMGVGQVTPKTAKRLMLSLPCPARFDIHYCGWIGPEVPGGVYIAPFIVKRPRQSAFRTAVGHPMFEATLKNTLRIP